MDTTIKLRATKILAVLGYIVSLRFIVYVEINTTLVSLKLSKIMRPPARLRAAPPAHRIGLDFVHKKYQTRIPITYSLMQAIIPRYLGSDLPVSKF